ncbi:hypothetical protein TWF730_003209 [Orbilia blumenaviensis]|uniref:Uncharacterized protein n=1 Tax=Orbilia blumenaviensis TaxID=1796055 RepID=A0AAV9U7R6_9PEZI
MFQDTPIYILLASLAAALALISLLYPKRRYPLYKNDSTTIQKKPLQPTPSTYPLKSYTLPQITSIGRFPSYAALTGVPLPNAYPTFNISTAKPRPYRPFRWAYHHTMALTKLEPDWWLELESTYPSRLLQRQKIFEQYGDRIIRKLSSMGAAGWRVDVACKEVMEMVVQFLCARYPQYFRLDAQSYVLYNKILGKEFDIYCMDPMQVVFQNVPEDFAIVLPDEGKGGKYVFVAGMICSSVGWDLGEKIGRVLGEVHGPVPEYKEKMGMSMDRYFSKLTTDKPIQRGSWDIVVGEPLFMSAEEKLGMTTNEQDMNIKEEDLTLRVDWQTLRRLPLSGGIVFNYKALFTPLKEFEDEPGVPALVEKVLREGNKKILEYKGTWHVEHVALPMLERMRRKQAEMGIWEEGREVKTLEESPFYRGWEEKWRRQQGF